MKNLLVSLLASFFILAFTTRNAMAIYDPLSVANNKYGIGIINTSDLGDAVNLVNSSGGDWGYLTVVISQNQRDKNTWQSFLDEARRKHVIPIFRVATKLDGNSWEKPDINDIDNWINFFNSLNWVSENRYVIVANEPNQAKEWGGKVNPEEYALYLKTFSERLKNASKDYFVLPAGLDSSAPNSKETMDEKVFIERMKKTVPNIFDYIDGWTSHSYPNPAFSGSEKDTGRRSIRNYEWEMWVLGGLGLDRNLPIFITETGWSQEKLSQDKISPKITYAFKEVWNRNKNIVAITPFILNYGSPPFDVFSWKDKNGNFYSFYDAVKVLSKEKGDPIQKTEGNIILNILQPTGVEGGYVNGFILIKNTGQTIWNAEDLKLIQEGGESLDLKVEGQKEIEPFRNSLIVYKVKLPDTSQNMLFKADLYIGGTKIGETEKTQISVLSKKTDILQRFLDWMQHFGKIQ